MTREWRELAACHNAVDPEAFFPETYRDYAEARWMHYCGPCPVKVECERSGQKEFGVWGGKTQNARRGKTPPIDGRTRRTAVRQDDIDRCVRCGAWTIFLVCPECAPVIVDWARDRGYVIADVVIPNSIARAWARAQLKGSA
jgi:hypothetical protein